MLTKGALGGLQLHQKGMAVVIQYISLLPGRDWGLGMGRALRRSNSKLVSKMKQIQGAFPLGSVSRSELKNDSQQVSHQTSFLSSDFGYFLAEKSWEFLLGS